MRSLANKVEETRKSKAEDAMKEGNLEENMVEMKSKIAALVAEGDANKREAEEAKAAATSMATTVDRLAAEVADIKREEETVRWVRRLVWR